MIDHDFINEHTQGFDAFIESIHAADWETIETQSGLTRDELKKAADIYLASNATIICWAMGLTQHLHAVPTIQMIVNLLLLKGNIGKPGAGACPVRGHSNVQGDRTMGITYKPKPSFLQRLGEVFDFTPPMEHGLDTVQAVEAMTQGKIKSFIAMGGNVVAAMSDTHHTAKALERCELTVQISTKLNRSHAVVGKEALILPCLGRTEKDLQNGKPQRITVEDSMSQVHASRGRNTPASDMLLSEPAIVAGIANATFTSVQADWDGMVNNYDLIREKIAQVLPMFEGINDKINTPGGFYLGNPARERVWNTSTGKANFTAHAIPDLSLPQGQLCLMTLRSHDQYNTTVYDVDDRYRGVKNARRIIFMHQDDLDQAGLKSEDPVTITSHYDDGIERQVTGFRVYAYDIPRGCAAGYFPELNPLVSINSNASGSNTPTSKWIPITLQKQA